MGARNTVFWNLSSIPWKSSTGSTEVGVPVGINPGGTGANILTKLLNRLADGSTTMLVQLPPGFEHDYLIRAGDLLGTSLYVPAPPLWTPHIGKLKLLIVNLCSRLPSFILSLGAFGILIESRG